MVGRPTSGRCDTCRKRKIKCDKTEPACRQCLKAGWKCPGYKTEYEFRHETSSSSSSSSESSHGVLSSRPSPVSSKDFFAVQLFRPQQQRMKLSPSSGYPAWNSADRLRWEFCSGLRTDTLPASLGFIPSHPYLELIPFRLGYDQVLDDAVACIVAFGNRPQLSENKLPLTNYHVPRYTRALQRLRIALESIDKGGMQPTTLAAMLLLHMFENHFGPNQGAPRVHSEGLEATFRRLGPQNLNDTLSWSVLNASLGNIAFKALLNGDDCFLASPPWVQLLQNHQSEAPTIQLLRDLTLKAALFPGLLKRFNEYRSRVGSTHLAEGSLPNRDDNFGMSHILMHKQLRQDLEQFQAALSSWILDDLDRRINQHDTGSPSSFTEAREYEEVFTLCLSFRSVSKMFLLYSQYMLLQLMQTTFPPARLGQLVKMLNHPPQEEIAFWEASPECDEVAMLAMDLRSDLVRLDSHNPRQSATVRATSNLVYSKLS